MSEEIKDYSLQEINKYLTGLPGRICSAKIEMEKKVAQNKKQDILINEKVSKLILSADRKLCPSAEMRKAFAESDEDIVNSQLTLVDEQYEEEVLKATYYKYVNFFQGVQERARNLRCEMRSLNDGA